MTRCCVLLVQGNQVTSRAGQHTSGACRMRSAASCLVVVSYGRCSSQPSEGAGQLRAFCTSDTGSTVWAERCMRVIAFLSEQERSRPLFIFPNNHDGLHRKKFDV